MVGKYRTRARRSICLEGLLAGNGLSEITARTRTRARIGLGDAVMGLAGAEGWGVTMFSGVRNAAVGLGAATLALAAGFSLPAQAAYTVTLVQQGPNVVADGSGSINLTSFGSPFFNVGFFSLLLASDGLIDTGPVSSVDIYSGITGPTTFGSGSEVGSSANGSGDLVGVSGVEAKLIVPASYVSGNPLSDSATYASAIFASLGVTPGTYLWTWGTGANADSFTLQIGPVTNTPEPASLTLLAMGLAGLGMVLRTRRA